MREEDKAPLDAPNRAFTTIGLASCVDAANPS